MFFFFFFFFAFYVLALRAQTRPAIEFGSGEEGLRPQFHSPFSFLSSFSSWSTGKGSAYSYGSSLFLYLLFYSVVVYVDMDALTYFKAPGPYCGAEERWRNVALTGSASV